MSTFLNTAFDTPSEAVEAVSCTCGMGDGHERHYLSCAIWQKLLGKEN